MVTNNGFNMLISDLDNEIFVNDIDGGWSQTMPFNMLFQEKLWCQILDAYKPNHEVTVMKAKTFLKSLCRQEKSLQVIPLTKEVWVLM